MIGILYVVRSLFRFNCEFLEEKVNFLDHSLVPSQWGIPFSLALICEFMFMLARYDV